MDDLATSTTPLYESYQNATVIDSYNSTSMTMVDTLDAVFNDVHATDDVTLGGRYHVPPAVMLLQQYVKIMVDIIGLLGNAVVIFMIVSFRDLHTAPNFHFLNMALADASLLLNNLVMKVGFAFDFNIYVALKCVPSYVQKVLVQTSTLTLVALSVDRYRLIVRPLKNLTEKSTLWVTISLVSVWIASFVLQIPVQVYITYNGSHCMVRVPWLYGDLAFKIYSNLLIFIIPMTVVVYCNVNILRKLQRGKPGVQITRGPGNQMQFPDGMVMTATNASASASASGKTRATPSTQRPTYGRRNGTKSFRSRSIRLVITVVLVYILFYLPFYLFHTVHMIPGAISNEDYLEGHTYFAVLLLCNSALNPFIYVLVGTNFRRHLRHMFCCLGCRCECRMRCPGAEEAQPPTRRDSNSTEQQP